MNVDRRAEPMVGTGDKGSIVWRPKSQQNAKALRSFSDAMNDIRDVLEYRPDAALSMDHIRHTSRKASVELRKLLLDGAPLVHRILEGPRFHPLRDKASLVGDIYENSFALRVAPAAEDGPPLAPFAEHTRSITVHPLHGLRFDSPEKRWVFESLFDTLAQPLTAWLNQRLFQVDQRVYSLHDTLKYVANKEAAHVDLDKDDESRDMERLHFGHTTYAQLVTVLVASYVLKQYRASRTENAELWGQFHRMSGDAVPEYKIIDEGEFPEADTSSLGFPGEFHDTGIPLPKPGRVWNPVQIQDHATVRP